HVQGMRGLGWRVQSVAGHASGDHFTVLAANRRRIGVGVLGPSTRKEPVEVRMLELRRIPAALTAATGRLGAGTEQYPRELQRQPLLAHAGGPMKQQAGREDPALVGGDQTVCHRAVAVERDYGHGRNMPVRDLPGERSSARGVEVPPGGVSETARFVTDGCARGTISRPRGDESAEEGTWAANVPISIVSIPLRRARRITSLA